MSHISSASHSTRSSGGFILRLGQNTRSRLLSGIFVSLLSLAVALMSSVTVLIKSRFSSGSWKSRERKAFISDLEGGRMPANEGIASVEREGGLRIAGRLPMRGPEGNPGPLRPDRGGLEDSDALALLSWVKAASKYGKRAWVRMGSGTRKCLVSTNYIVGGSLLTLAKISLEDRSHSMWVEVARAAL